MAFLAFTCAEKKSHYIMVYIANGLRALSIYWCGIQLSVHFVAPFRSRLAITQFIRSQGYKQIALKFYNNNQNTSEKDKK